MSDSPPSLSAADVVSLAVDLHRKGKTDDAEQLYRRILQDVPDQVDALHFFGLLCHQKGDSAQAVKLIRQALRVDPQYAGARINLGNVLKEQGKYTEAENQFRKAIETGAEDGNAYNNLGVTLRMQKRLAEAIDAFEKATQFQPPNWAAFRNLGNALKADRQIDAALTAYRRALEIDPSNSDSHLQLGRALYSFGRIDEAKLVYEKWTEAEPDNPIATHMLAACQDGPPPQRCSDEFVRQSFDAFANSFDEVLNRLDYRAPELVGEAVRGVLSAPESKLAILDAGCGTGLCGSYLKPFSKHLCGVDLSAKMLERAAATGLYDERVASELTEHMLQNQNRYDLIVSADTLVYFGDLAPVLSAAAMALRDGGTLIFTVERDEESAAPDGFRLQPHGRYSHAEGYVCEQLAEAGFRLSEVRNETLRMEVKQPVAGLVVTAQKDPR